MALMIGEINAIASSIAAAVEEQSAATSEISCNVHQAAEGTRKVTENLMGVTQAAEDSSGAARQVLKASGLVNDGARNLRERIEHFLSAVEAA